MSSVIWSIFIGLLIIIALVSVITVLIYKLTNKKQSKGKIFLGKLNNTDCSIKEAVNYLKITNGIKDNMNGSV